jgi:hypothetical protein
MPVEFDLSRLELAGPGVYVIHANGTALYKIGKTTNVASRIAELQSGSPLRLVVVRFIPYDDPAELETLLHLVFWPYRIPHSEWFRLPERASNQLKSLRITSELWRRAEKMREFFRLREENEP